MEIVRHVFSFLAFMFTWLLFQLSLPFILRLIGLP